MSTPVRARTSEGRAASEPGIWKRALMRNIWSENLRMQNQNFYIALKLGCPSPAKMSLAMPVAYDLMLELLHQHMGNYLQSSEKEWPQDICKYLILCLSAQYNHCVSAGQRCSHLKDTRNERAMSAWPSFLLSSAPHHNSTAYFSCNSRQGVQNHPHCRCL